MESCTVYFYFLDLYRSRVVIRIRVNGIAPERARNTCMHLWIFFFISLYFLARKCCDVEVVTVTLLPVLTRFLLYGSKECS